MTKNIQAEFDVGAFLATTQYERTAVRLTGAQTFFSQGDSADCVYFLQEGRVKISAISAAGKKATVRLVSAGEFFGEKAIAPEQGLRVTTATAMTACGALRVARPEFLRLMREESVFSNSFSSLLLACNLRVQADLVDQLFNRVEKRLARILLLMAVYSHPEDGDPQIPQISQEALANMIGSSRPRVNTFMNRFRKLGFIEYNSHIRVHKSLLNVFLRD